MTCFDADREETFRTIHRLAAIAAKVPIIPVYDHGVVTQYVN